MSLKTSSISLLRDAVTSIETDPFYSNCLKSQSRAGQASQERLLYCAVLELAIKKGRLDGPQENRKRHWKKPSSSVTSCMNLQAKDLRLTL